MAETHYRVRSAQYLAKKKVKQGRKPKTPPPSPTEFRPKYEMPEWAKVLNIYIRNVDSKAQAAVMQINILNKNIEKLHTQIDALSAQVLRSHQFILRLLDDPEAAHHAEAIVRDFNIQKYTTP